MSSFEVFLAVSCLVAGSLFTSAAMMTIVSKAKRVPSINREHARELVLHKASLILASVEALEEVSNMSNEQHERIMIAYGAARLCRRWAEDALNAKGDIPLSELAAILSIASSLDH